MKKGGTKPPFLLPLNGVPEIGIEPIRSCERQILSLLRLPVPPPGRWAAILRYSSQLVLQPF